MNYERQILREGWFDKVVSFFKGTALDSQKLANAWLSEQEIEVGHDLDEDFKNQVQTFVSNRYERALQTYADESYPERKAARVIVSLLDKRFGAYIDELIDLQDQALYSRKRKM